MTIRLNVFAFILLAGFLIFKPLLSGCTDDFPKRPLRQIKLAADTEFVNQDDGLAAFEEHYGFQFDHVYEMAIGLTHEALRAGDVDAAKGYATDGKIEELELLSLNDDKVFFPPSNPAPVIREEILEQHPEIEEILSQVAARLDNQAMTYLNYLVDLEEYPPAEAAHEWLQKEGLISTFIGSQVESQSDVEVIISSKTYSEQIILGYIALIALEYGGIPVADRTGLGDTPSIRSALLDGNIHLYWEYTNTAWNTIYEREETIFDADELYQQVAREDAELGLVWLDYAPFDNTCTILMRREHAEDLGISTISELATWVKIVQAQNP